MGNKISKILILASIFFLAFLFSTTQAAVLNMDEFKEEVANINEYADYVYIIGKYAFTSASGDLSIQDVMLAARSIQISPEDGEIKDKPAFGKMTVHELEPILDDNDETIGWKIVNNMVGDTELLLDDNNKINIEYIDYNKLISKYHVTFKSGYENGEQKTIRVEENTNIPENEIPSFSREGYKFKGWFKEDGTEFKPNETAITKDITLEAKWYEIVDISKLLKEAAGKIKSEDYGAEFKDGTLTFNVYNKSKKNSDIAGTGLIGDIVGLLSNKYITKLKITCTAIEADNYVEFTKDMVGSGSGPESATWLKFQDLLKKATGKDNFIDITLGDLVNSGDMKLDVTIDTDNAVAKDDKIQFNIKLIEIVKSDKLAEEVTKLISSGNGYEASYENGTITINMEDTKKELNSVTGSNMLATLYSMLKDNVKAVDISIKNGASILTANREELQTYNREWLLAKLKEQNIEKNRDLVNKEFVLTLHLDENAKTSEEAKEITYNIVFKATTYTVTFVNGENETEQTVIQGDKVSKPEPDPSKEGYAFKFWKKQGEDQAYNFEDPVESNLILEASFEKALQTDTLVKNVVNGIKSNDFKVNYEEGTITIDVTNIDKEISEISGTNIFVELDKVIKTEGVKSVTVTYESTSAEFSSENELNYKAMAEKLLPVIAQMKGQESDLYSLVGKEIKVKIKADDNYILESEDVKANSNEVEYKIEITSDYVRVTDEASLNAAVKGEKGHIVVAKSFDVNNDIEIKRNVIIESNEKNEITAKSSAAENYIFKIAGDEKIQVTLKNLKLKEASSAIFVGDNAVVIAENLDVSTSKASAVKVSSKGTFTGTNLVYTEENYKKPAIEVLAGGTVTNKNNYACVENPYEIIRKENEDVLNAKEGITHYYIEQEHTNLYQITFRLKGSALFRFCMQNEKPIPPKSVENPYDDIVTKLCRYTFNNKWGVLNETAITGSEMPPATKNVVYSAQYTETPFTQVKSKQDLQTAISKLDETNGLPIIITLDSAEELNIGNLEINTSQPVTLIGKGNITLKGTITATSNVPSLSLHKLNIEGDGSGNQKQGDSSNRYYIIKSEAKNFTMWYTKIANKAQDKIAYSAIYLPAKDVKANIRWNTFDVENVYNTIEFGYGNAVKSGTVISSNNFIGENQTNNHINIYTVEENAKIEISNNKFDVSKNAIRLTNTTGVPAQFVISGNVYKKTSEEEQYKGFILMQMSKTDSDEFSKYTIISSNNKGPENKLLTADKTNKDYRFEYYASADGQTVYENLDESKGAKIAFNN